jgi:hypothetical protein
MSVCKPTITIGLRQVYFVVAEIKTISPVLSERAVVAICTDMIERFLEPFFMRWILAAVAKGREMLATIPLRIYIAATSGAGLLRSRPYWSVPIFR